MEDEFAGERFAGESFAGEEFAEKISAFCERTLRAVCRPVLTVKKQWVMQPPLPFSENAHFDTLTECGRAGAAVAHGHAADGLDPSWGVA